ncbi:DUF6377 domain-containing protein [Desertivirga brevis]|uniref:DUF6377 domain-containing protein n=1 Tax=Desertivirga brevis TaxID=2810310 RepID=UPI001A9571D6|nr:DUF6377 domain-containing protein [Pedobacter sp. SYSU D00873]
MRIFLVFLFLLLTRGLSYAFDQRDSLISELNLELGQKQVYDAKREAALQELKAQLKRTAPGNALRQYKLCAMIFEAYKSYQFDSAYTYVNRMGKLSSVLKDRAKQYDTKVKLGFILLSSGMFKETFDSVKEVRVGYLTDSTKIDYYSMLTRAYYDLASYVNDRYYSPQYNKLANQYIDSAITISETGSFNKLYWTAYKSFKNKDYNKAETELNQLLKKQGLSEHEFAIASSTLSNLYTSTRKGDRAIDLLIQAAIADIRSSTKETVALFWLSEILYKEGDIVNAYNYIRHAMADAEFYGARQRQLQISTVLPIVAAEKLNNSEREKTQFLIYLFSISLLAIIIILFSIMLYKQLKKLQTKERIIEDTNKELERINEKLLEGTRIKEEYIGYFFNVISGYISKLEKLKRSVDMKLSVKKYEDIKITIDGINIKKERETLFYTFDHVFLKIFPNFVKEFNALFKPEDQIWPKENEVLTTDLRIFALIRMGIEDNAAIANILEYSEKTIYVYKMRLKAKALIHGEEFEKRIMSIRAETQASA